MKMNIKEIKQLVKLMVDNDLGEMDIEEGENKIHLRRQNEEGPVQISAPMQAQMPAQQPAPAPATPGPAVEPAAPAKIEEAPADNLIEVKSPMVGTFYEASSPDSGPFVSTGDKVGADTVVCIVEAMKVMNEIKAECSGTVTEICVENAQPVEFGQVLFRVKPA
ncbi:MAG: acetyl-CoA carboxylase biotin carboxyl carrier protein [Phycisphaerae bacterium]